MKYHEKYSSLLISVQTLIFTEQCMLFAKHHWTLWKSFKQYHVNTIQTMWLQIFYLPQKRRVSLTRFVSVINKHHDQFQVEKNAVSKVYILKMYVQCEHAHINVPYTLWSGHGQFLEGRDPSWAEQLCYP